jgi:hypothetical protein
VPTGIGGHGGPPYFTKIASKFMMLHTRSSGFKSSDARCRRWLEGDSIVVR